MDSGNALVETWIPDGGFEIERQIAYKEREQGHGSIGQRKAHPPEEPSNI